MVVISPEASETALFSSFQSGVQFILNEII